MFSFDKCNILEPTCFITSLCIHYLYLYYFIVKFLCVCVFQEQGEGQNGSERGGLKRGQNQLPYYLSRGVQDQGFIKAGYCVKQGAVVRAHGKKICANI